MPAVPLKLVGLNNLLSDTEVSSPKDERTPGSFRDAVNIDFDNSGDVVFPRLGSTRVYTGTACHSWHELFDDTGLGLFVDGADLKLLNADYSATTLHSGVGVEPMSYAKLGDYVYYSNGKFSGKYKNGSRYEWGVDVPPRQPDVTAVSTGGMYGGDYRVAITWLADGEESGTFGAAQVTVPDGGGIRVNNFPTPPAYVEAVAVYVSSVNGNDLYLYTYDADDYPADVSEITIRFCVGTIKLETQFASKVKPGIGLTAHNGGIFWRDGELVRYTDAHSPGLYRSYQFFNMEHDVLCMLGLRTGPLFVQTKRGLYQITGTYTDQPQILQLTMSGGTKDAAFYDYLNNIGYIFSDHGFLEVSLEGAKLLDADNVATPTFDKGSLAVVEHNGIRRLIGVFQNGTVSPLQHPDYGNSL